jgi:hypothetical protein
MMPLLFLAAASAEAFDDEAADMRCHFLINCPAARSERSK